MKIGERATRQIANSMVTSCRKRAMIDPSVTFRWQKGKIADGAVWQQLAVDVTHVNGRPYLSCIDCASRFTAWRALRNESAKEISLSL